MCVGKAVRVPIKFLCPLECLDGSEDPLAVNRADYRAVPIYADCARGSAWLCAALRVGAAAPRRWAVGGLKRGC